MADLRIAVAGAGGRMGLANMRAVVAAEGVVLHSAFDRGDSPAVGRDAGVAAGLEPADVVIGDSLADALEGADALFDFTAPSATVAFAAEVARRGLIHIIGTTGCSADDDIAISAAAAAGATIVKSGNFSLGVNVLAALVRKAAAALDENFDIEVLEMHHRKKVDAPSGTALLLGRAAAEGRNIALEKRSIRSRDGHTGPRPAGDIGFATLRGGSVVGDHSVIFAGLGERLELVHRAEDRTLFAQGAIKAALWASGQQPGLYDMADVLGLKEAK